MRPLVVSHRTNAGSHPENSLIGIEAAIADGADAVEFDLRRTADGRLVLLHDQTLERTAGDPRPVESLTFDELSAVALGGEQGFESPETVPSLDQALDLLAGRAVAVIDVKVPLEAELTDALGRRHDPAVWVWTAEFDLAARLRRFLPSGVPISMIVGPRTVEHHGALPVLDWASRVGLTGLVVEPELLSCLWVEAASARGLQCYSGNVTSVEAADRAIRSRPLAICTDVPRLVFTALSAPTAADPLGVASAG